MPGFIYVLEEGWQGFYILLGTLVLGGAAAAYFFYFKPKMDEKKKEAEPLPDQDKENQPQPTPQPSTDSGLMETPFKNEGQGDAFRAWVNKFYPAYAKSIDLDISGKTNTTAIKKHGLNMAMNILKAIQTGKNIQEALVH